MWTDGTPSIVRKHKGLLPPITTLFKIINSEAYYTQIWLNSALKDHWNTFWNILLSRLSESTRSSTAGINYNLKRITVSCLLRPAGGWLPLSATTLIAMVSWLAPLMAATSISEDSSAGRLPGVWPLIARAICLGRNERAGMLPMSDARHKQRHPSL